MRRFIPHWRKATWAIAIWTGLMLLFTVIGLSNTGGPTDCGVLDQQSCEAAYGAGVGLGVGILFFIWLIGFSVLSIIWFMSRPRYIEYKGQLLKESEARKLSKQS